MSERKRIYLCLAHMSDDGMEQKYVRSIRYELGSASWPECERLREGSGRLRQSKWQN